MDKEEIAALLVQNHERFARQLNGLREDEFYHTPVGKWNAAQQLDHIIKSVGAVAFAFRVPRFIVKWKFGTANRPSKTYDQLVEKYKRKLSEGYSVSERFTPSTAIGTDKKEMLEKLMRLIKSLSKNTSGLSEEALDRYVLPHPLLGKLTFREMLYFTAYHVNHHAALVEKGLERFQAPVM